GRFLYVINQNTSDKGLFPQGNQLHVLHVGSDGKLTEPKGPHVFSQAEVPSVAHPQGIAVVRTEGERDDDRDRGDQGRADRSRGDAFASDAALRSRSSFSAAIDNVLDLLLREKTDKNGSRYPPVPCRRMTNGAKPLRALSGFAPVCAWHAGRALANSEAQVQM